MLLEGPLLQIKPRLRRVKGIDLCPDALPSIDMPSPSFHTEKGAALFTTQRNPFLKHGSCFIERVAIISD